MVHHANSFYGHSSIFARFLGLNAADPPPIRGFLQHGWNTHDGFAVGHYFYEGFPKLVWSDAVARRGHALGLHDYVVVGSPWAYLLYLEGQKSWEEQVSAGEITREGTIVFPFHGWEGQEIMGDHAVYAAQVRAVEGNVPLTMCLYWNDYEKDEVRGVYEQAGFRVITLGYRGLMEKRGNTDFLDNQLRELRAHKRVVSNRMGSALLYGAATGAEIGIYGNPMVIENDHAVLGGMARQKRLLPHWHQERVPPRRARVDARRELGFHEMRSPEFLAKVFGWTAADLHPELDDSTATE